MTITAALFFILCFTVGSSLFPEQPCRNLIQCPCGTTGRNLTICKQEAHNESCKKWSKCKDCNDGLTICSTCPDGFEGPFCSRDVNQNISRQNRRNSLLRSYRDTMCPNPGQVANTDRLSTDGSLSLTIRPFREGQSLVFSCHPGFGLQGRSIITCQASGRWSARTPQCTRLTPTNRPENAGLRFCDDPGTDPNGNRQPGSPPNRRGFPQGSRIVYSCKEGYNLRGAKSIICDAAGQWSDSIPQCEKSFQNLENDVLYCLKPQSIANGRVRYIVPGETVGVEGFKFPTDCGRSLIERAQVSRPGKQTVNGEYPWIVFLSIESDETFCAGALLSRNTVITVAHCVTRNSSLTLLFGKHYRKLDEDDEGVISRKVEKIVIHRNFNSSTMDSDIALLTFEPSVIFSRRIQPICLPTRRSSLRNLKSGNIGEFAGWGLTDKELYADELKLASLPVLSNEECTESFRRQGRTLSITRNMFCAGNENGEHSPCIGDGGSPLIFYDSSTDRYALEGLVSFGPSGQCGLPGRYTVFTRISAFLPWILENMK